MITVTTCPTSLPMSDDMRSWAQENCPSFASANWKVVIGKRLLLNFYFAEKDDATLFALRWA